MLATCAWTHRQPGGWPTGVVSENHNAIHVCAFLRSPETIGNNDIAAVAGTVHVLRPVSGITYAYPIIHVFQLSQATEQGW